MPEGFSVLENFQNEMRRLKVSDLTLGDLDVLVNNLFSGLDDLMLRHVLLSALAPKIVEHEVAVASWRMYNPGEQELPKDLANNLEILNEAKRNITDAFSWFEIEY